jgi:polar amino acid transport system permease protein/cystine transport system permease protein
MAWLANLEFTALLASAFHTTVLLSAAVIVLSNLLALPLAMHLQRRAGRFRRVIIAYSFFARAVPALAILFGLYYGLPSLGIYLEPVPSALIGLVFASTAYNLEFLRSGLESVPRGQLEAARALGLRRGQAYRRVILPQAYAAAGPALFSNAIQMVKGSSLASLVAVTELTAASTTVIAETYEAISVLGFIAVLYGVIAAALLGLQALHERRLARHLGRG